MPFYVRRGDIPRKRHIVFRDNGPLLTEEVMGLEGFTGNESILYHLQSPCRVKELGEFEPIERDEWVPDAHAHRHFATAPAAPSGDEISGRRVLMWNDDVEISLCRPAHDDGLLLPKRRARRDRVRPRGDGHARDDLRRRRLQGRRLRRHPARHDVPLRAGGRAAASRLRVARADDDPGPVPQRVRPAARGGAVLEPRPPSAGRAADASRRGRVRRQGARARRLPDVRPRLPPVRRRRLGRLPLPVDVLRPRLRADHGPHPPATADAPDVPGAELRHLLVLPAQARLRPGGDPDPVPPLESPVRGDDLLRLRELRLAQEHRGRVDHAPSVGPAARAAPGPRGEVDRRRRDDGARRHVRHVPAAQAVHVRARARRRPLRVLVVRAGRGRSRASPA